MPGSMRHSPARAALTAALTCTQVAVSNCHVDNGKDSNQRWSIGSDGLIRVALDGKCLQATAAGTIEVAMCDTGDAKQKWTVQAKLGVGTLMNQGKCLSAVSSGKLNCGNAVKLQTCVHAWGHPLTALAARPTTVSLTNS